MHSRRYAQFAALALLSALPALALAQGTTPAERLGQWGRQLKQLYPEGWSPTRELRPGKQLLAGRTRPIYHAARQAGVLGPGQRLEVGFGPALPNQLVLPFSCRVVERNGRPAAQRPVMLGYVHLGKGRYSPTQSGSERVVLLPQTEAPSSRLHQEWPVARPRRGAAPLPGTAWPDGGKRYRRHALNGGYLHR